METIWRIFAGIGAGAVLFALTFVTLLIGGLVNGMVVLFAEKPISRFLEKRGVKR